MSEKLTDDQLELWAVLNAGNVVGGMARELLAYRRAPAAPATPAEPVAWLVEDLHRVSRVTKIATTARKHVEGIYSDPTEFRVTPLYAAPATPAPSSHAISKAWAERRLPLDEGVTPSAGAPTPARDDLRAARLPLLDLHMWTESAEDDEMVILRVGTVRRIRAALRDAGGTDGAPRDAQGGASHD